MCMNMESNKTRSSVDPDVVRGHFHLPKNDLQCSSWVWTEKLSAAPWYSGFFPETAENILKWHLGFWVMISMSSGLSGVCVGGVCVRACTHAHLHARACSRTCVCLCVCTHTRVCLCVVCVFLVPKTVKNWMCHVAFPEIIFNPKMTPSFLCRKFSDTPSLQYYTSILVNSIKF